MTDDQNVPPSSSSPPPSETPNGGDTGEEAAAATVPRGNPFATAAYYIGVLSIVPITGAVLGPIALICGLLGLRYAAKNEGVEGHANAYVGIGCGGFFVFFYSLAAAIVILSALFGAAE